MILFGVIIFCSLMDGDAQLESECYRLINQ